LTPFRVWHHGSATSLHNPDLESVIGAKSDMLNALTNVCFRGHADIDQALPTNLSTAGLKGRLLS
jgi:hypothetical protein